MQELKYPIGEYKRPENLTEEIIREYIHQIKCLPDELEKTIAGLTEEELNVRYRPEGWTIKQVIHHLADSHINSYTRFKLALTEDKPVIKPYYEDRWAELEDGRNSSIKFSIDLLKALHSRWGVLFESLNDEELKRKFIHPEHGREIELRENLGIYAWHGKHHLAHIDLAKRKFNK